MALVSGTRSSTLNPNAPLFIPCYMRQVEDFSPEWWNLVTSSTWFREHWLSENQVEDENSFFDGDDNIIDLLPDSIDFDIGVDEETLNMEAQYEEFLMSAQPVKTNQVNGWGKDAGAMVKSLSFNRERGVRSVIEPARHYEKPAKFVSGKCSPRPIQQPR